MFDPIARTVRINIDIPLILVMCETVESDPQTNDRSIGSASSLDKT